MISSCDQFLLSPRSGVLIVAHPDDETLWAGGLLLETSGCRWFIAVLCRKSDPDRSVKFRHILERYGAAGAMADLDDGPDQTPLAEETVKETILNIIPVRSYDLLLTHAPDGEYTRHRRHEEVSRAAASLWAGENISVHRMGMFAYQDSQGKILPSAIQNAHCIHELPAEVFTEKYRLITQVYGFDPASWEARAVPNQEAFWCFSTPQEFNDWQGMN